MQHIQLIKHAFSYEKTDIFLALSRLAEQRYKNINIEK